VYLAQKREYVAARQTKASEKEEDEGAERRADLLRPSHLQRAVYAWFPKVFGVRLSERLGRWHFWTFFVGMNVTFFPMHLLGFQGMPRRIYTFPHGTGWEPLNLLATAGAGLTGVAMVVFVVNIVYSVLRREVAPANPWKAGTLEWLADSPPAQYNFALIPVVTRREALWNEEAEPLGVIDGVLIDDPAEVGRDPLATTGLDAEPDHIVTLPGPSL
jgi:cytochrome c oxidase subunit I+III